MRVSERGQITIPKTLRDRFGINQNVEVEMIPTKDGLLIQKERLSRIQLNGSTGCLQKTRYGRIPRGNPRAMITAVDSGVLLDVFLRDQHHGDESRERLRTAYGEGAIAICDVVNSELAAAFPDRATLDRALREINAATSPINTSIAFEAGVRWKRYRQAGGPRKRIITDFLIGAHAVSVADQFLTRDRGFFASYFPELSAT